MSDSIASYAADQAYKSYPNILDSLFPSFAEASEGHCAGMTQHRNMNSESKFKPEIYKSPNVEEKETSRDDLKRDASELASLIGLEISESDLRVAVNGPSDETEKPILFRLGEMSARMEYKADTSFKDSFEKRSCGSKCLLLRGIQYIKEDPFAAEECFRLARQVWDRDINWEDVKIPNPDIEIQAERLEIETEEKEMKKAA